MTMFRRLIQRFTREETGTLMAEAVIVLPVMLWSYLALFVYWDSYRAINTVQKAAYTVSDMLSRERTSITEAYIVGMDSIIEYMIDQDQEAKVRVSEIKWSQINNRYEIHWSRSPNGALPQLTTASVAALKGRLPVMADGDRVVLVEVEVNYHASFNVGVDDQTIKQFIVTRPRFLPRICLVGVTCA